eukprot:2265068-Prymnesium_polylepis.1
MHSSDRVASFCHTTSGIDRSRSAGIPWPKSDGFMRKGRRAHADARSAWERLRRDRHTPTPATKAGGLATATNDKI